MIVLAGPLPRYGKAGYLMVFRPLQGIGPGGAGEHQDNLPVGDAPALLGFQKSLQIGAAAGDQDGNPRLPHGSSSTPPSPRATDPTA